MPTRPFTRFSGALTSLLLVASSLLITALLPWLGNRDLALAVFRAREQLAKLLGEDDVYLPQ